MAEFWKSPAFIRNVTIGVVGGGLVAWLWKRSQRAQEEGEDEGPVVVSSFAPPTVPPTSPPSTGGGGAQPSGSREADLLTKIAAGDYDVDWVPVTSQAGGHTATFYVTGDAIKVDGVRQMVSATLLQQIADLLDARLMTPKVADLAFAQADVRLLPMPRPITSSIEAMNDQSQKIDAAILQATGQIDGGRGKLVSTVGKTWVTDKHWASSPMAVNYGWHFSGPSFGGQTWSQTETGVVDPRTGKPLRMIQGRGFAHDRMHQDYSQNATLVRNKVVVDGREMSWDEVLTNADLAPLASHQGPLSVLRQPGVPTYRPNV